MAVRPQDARWKTARSRLTKEQIIESLMKGADRLFSERVSLRDDSGMLQDAYDDATGLVTHDMYANPQVKKTRDMLYELDHMIGNVAREMEFLARNLKGVG